ncbi:MAG: dTDP-4-dehydrorhamnose reductase [Protaetiibacter sp.]
MTRYLIAGADGMLGRDLRLALAGRELRAPSRAELDITDPSSVADAVRDADVVINAAAYTSVDAAEGEEDRAYAVNAAGAGNLARAAADAGARFVQISTDYVFRGDATTPYPEDAPLDPLGAYGRTKAAGERLVRQAHPDAYIVRTAWLYGRHGSSFPRTMLRLAGERETVSVVTDQVGQPTWTRDLGAAVVRLLDAGAPSGVYHGTNSGRASWFELARATFALAGLDPERVLPTDSATFTRTAPRPGFSVLGHDAWARAGLDAPRAWQDALAEAVPELLR